MHPARPKDPARASPRCGHSDRHSGLALQTYVLLNGRLNWDILQPIALPAPWLPVTRRDHLHRTTGSSGGYGVSAQGCQGSSPTSSRPTLKHAHSGCSLNCCRTYSLNGRSNCFLVGRSVGHKFTSDCDMALRLNSPQAERAGTSADGPRCRVAATPLCSSHARALRIRATPCLHGRSQRMGAEREHRPTTCKSRV